MAKRILICGLPGSGKTTFARELASRLDAQHVNGDAVREAANNWDFTLEGRMEQALRMRAVADTCTGLVVSDFVAPTPCLLYTSPSPRDKRQSRMPSSA